MAVRKNRIKRIHSSRNNQELEERYNQWAKDYDTDLKQEFEWQGPQRTAEIFVKHVPKGARILDAGAGTGLVGRVLFALDYRNLIAMDLSRGMLKEARKTKVYSKLHQMVMGESLNFPTDSFDAVVSVGVLTLGHAPASSFDELIRVTCPGGYIIFTLLPEVYENNGFKEKQSALESDGQWKLIEVSEPYQALPMGEPDKYHRVWVYQIT